MKKSTLAFSVIGIITCLSAVVQATIVEYKLDDPVLGDLTFEREMKEPVLVAVNSSLDIYVENIENPNRWKDWKIIIWVPVGDPPLESIEVDYSNDPLHIEELERFVVPLAPYTGPIDLGNEWVGFYADTWLPEWEEFGTSPVCSGGLHPWGNPAWVSFHFDVGVDPFIYIKDACIPEPATVTLLGLGGLVFLHRRKSM